MDIEQEENEFSIDLQKLMVSEVAATLWAPNMDLFALTTFDNLLQLYRISFKAQKVFQAEQDKPIKGIAFSPDSQLLAYGVGDGAIKLVKTQNGEQILSLQGAHAGQLQTLSFVPYSSLDSTLFMPFQKNSLESKLILNISPHKNCNRKAIVKLNSFAELKKQFTLLLSTEKTKTAVSLNGFLPIAQIDYQQLGFSTPRAFLCHYDGTIRAIVGEERGAQVKLWHMECQARVLREWREPLIKASCLLGYISEALAFAEVAYDSAEVIIRDALRQLKQKMVLIDDPDNPDFSPCQELFRFLNCGTTSTALVNFFTKEVYDSKLLEKLDESLNQCFSKLHDLLLQSIQNSLERAHLLLSRLKDLAQGTHGQRLGLSPDRLGSAEKKLIRLYTMGEALLVESTEAKFDIRNLLVWLNKSTIKSAGENEAEIENSKSYLNKYSVDFSRLHGFLKEEKKFKLQNLLTFFSKTNTHHTIHLQKPEFSIFKNPQQASSKEAEATFQRLAALLEVDDASVGQQAMDVEESYRSFKLEMKDLRSEWKELMKEPVRAVSIQLKKDWKRTLVGTVEESQLFPLELQSTVREGELLVYFVERLEDRDRLVRFNCHSGVRESLTATRHHILSIAVAEQVLVVLEDKFTNKKMVAEVANASFNDGEIEVGKRISRVEGELDINCSMRGLNSLVVDKNKLIVFD